MTGNSNATPPASGGAASSSAGGAMTDQQYLQKGSKGSSRTGIIVAVIVVVLIVVGVGVAYAAGWIVKPGTKGLCNGVGTVSLTGAGSTFIYPMMSVWSTNFNNQYSCAQVSYNSIGSGGGISQLTSKLVDYGASDAPLSPSQRAALPAPAFTIPDALGAVTVIYNVGSTLPMPLNLSGTVVAGIFLGQITTWNNPAITSLNPKLTLPSTTITVVHRSDGSGTSFVFTHWLAADNATWASKVGAGLSVSWPTGEGEKGSTGVAGTVASTVGAIGYAEENYAKIGGVGYAAIQNPSGNFIWPNATNTAAAATDIAGSLPSGSGDWANVSIINQPGAQTYPLATLTYVIVYQDLGKAYGSGFSHTDAQWEVNFLHWIVGTGQNNALELFFVPMPNALTQLDYATIGEILYNGASLTAQT